MEVLKIQELSQRSTFLLGCWEAAIPGELTALSVKKKLVKVALSQ